MTTLTHLERLEAESISGGSQNLFSAAVNDAQAELEAARTFEQGLQAKRAESEEIDNQARENLSNAKQALTNLTAEQSALDKVLSRGKTADWTPALSKIDVKKGYEQALAAALGEDLEASISEPAPMQWQGAPTPDSKLPGGVTSLLDVANAPDELSARLSQIGIADDGQIDSLRSALKPGQRLVTLEGRIVRWDGFEVRAEAETAAAIRLKQQTRLGELSDEVHAQTALVDTAAQNFETAREARRAAEDALCQRVEP